MAAQVQFRLVYRVNRVPRRDVHKQVPQDLDYRPAEFLNKPERIFLNDGHAPARFVLDLPRRIADSEIAQEQVRYVAPELPGIVVKLQF
jgi:hypothetical protein